MAFQSSIIHNSAACNPTCTVAGSSRRLHGSGLFLKTETVFYSKFFQIFELNFFFLKKTFEKRKLSVTQHTIRFSVYSTVHNNSDALMTRRRRPHRGLIKNAGSRAVLHFRIPAVMMAYSYHFVHHVYCPAEKEGRNNAAVSLLQRPFLQQQLPTAP